MTVGVTMDFEGATLEQYDQIIEKMGFTRRGTGGPGGLFHWVAETDSGLHIVDVWESEEAYNNFAQSKISPLARDVGMPEPPTVTIQEVHNYLTAG